MNDYPEKYNRLLKEDEVVIWHSKFKGGTSGKTLKTISILTVFIAIISIVISFLYTTPFWVIIMFSFPIISWISEKNKLNKSYHLATDKRIIIDTTPRSKFAISSYYYDKIKAVKLVKPNRILAIINHNEHPGFNLEFKEVENPEETHQLIHDAWKKEYFKEKENSESRYILLDTILKPIAKKHKLKYINKNPKKSDHIYMNGTINEMPIQFNLKKRSITFSIECNNKGNNHLRIIRESMGASFGKLIGAQDIIIDDEKFDNRFILQSDNEHFIKTILDIQTRNNLLQASKLLDWDINFGIKKTSNKNKNQKGNNDILDDEFILENIQSSANNDKAKSRLVYYCEDIESNSSYLPFVVKHLELNFETIVKLASNIQSYNKV